MNPTYTSNYRETINTDRAEWLGTTFGNSFAISIAGAVLLMATKTNEALTLWIFTCWSSFIFSFVWYFWSERLAIALVVIGSEVLAYYSHAPWWAYLVAPLGAIFEIIIGLTAGAIFAIILCVAYKAFVDGDNKETIFDYSRAVAVQLGLAIEEFASSETLKFAWMLSILARLLSIGFLLSAVNPNPAELYEMTRWALYLTCMYSSVIAILQIITHQAKTWYIIWTAIFWIIAILFNPILEIHLPRQLWIPIDWTTSVLLFVSIFLYPRTFGNACFKWWQAWQTDGLYLSFHKRRMMEENDESIEVNHATSANTQAPNVESSVDQSKMNEELKAELEYLSQQPRGSDSFTKLMAAAQLGHSGAQYFIGRRYDSTVLDRDESVSKDDTKAAIWYRRSALQGHSFAQHRLGALYELGRGVDQNYELAASWYQKAADQWDAEAFNSLGLLYASGHGVPHDLVQAIKYLCLAKTGRRVDLGADLESVEKMATEEQILEGHRIADECISRISRNKIVLDCGVTVEILSLFLEQTYLGLLEGSPNEFLNKRIIKQFRDRVNEIWEDCNPHVIPPITKNKYSSPYLPRYSVAVWLREHEGGSKQLVVILFADIDKDQEFHISIKDHVRSIDWISLATEWDI